MPLPRTYLSNTFRRFSGLFWPLFDSILGSNTDKVYGFPKLKSKIDSKEPKNRLKLVNETSSVLQKERKKEHRALFEQAWQNNPESFLLSDNPLEQQRVTRTLTLIQKWQPTFQTAVDLGCGAGEITEKVLQYGSDVDAVDIAEPALERCKERLNRYSEKVRFFQETLPRTKLPDYRYDLCLALDLIGDISVNDHRLFMAEVSRLLAREGIAVVSTPLDIDTEGALDSFIALFETEFVVQEVVFSYHAFCLRFPKWMHAEKLWRPLEKCTQFLLDERGVSHVILVGKKKPLF